MMQNNEAAMREAVSKKILSYIGLAQKAGKVAAGEFLTEKAMISGRLYTLIKEIFVWSQMTKPLLLHRAMQYSTSPMSGIRYRHPPKAQPML